MDNREHILAVGDIHGMHRLLMRVFEEVVPQLPPETRLVFLGDYIDRGPDSAQVLDTLIRLKRQRPQSVFLLGNHERMLLNARRGRRVNMFLVNGGQETLASYGLDEDGLDSIPAGHLDFLESLELYWQTPGYIFVHAGLRPGVPLAEQKERDLIWIRGEFYMSSHDFGKLVIFGHTPFDEPLVQSNLIGIDTGAVYGNKLTCLKLPERRFFHLEYGQ